MSRAGAAPAASPEGTRRVAGAGPHAGVPSDARVVAEVGLAHAVSHFHQLALVPLFPALRDAFAMSWSQPRLLMTVSCPVSCVGQAAAGFVVDAHGARRALSVAFGLFAAGLVVAVVGAATGAAAWLMAFIVCAGAGMLAGGFIAAATSHHDATALLGLEIARRARQLPASSRVPKEPSR